MKPKCYLESVAVEVNLNIGELGAMVIKVVVTQVEVCVANVRSKLLLVVLFQKEKKIFGLCDSLNK